VTEPQRMTSSSNIIPEGLDVRDVIKKPAVVQTVLATTDNLQDIFDWITVNGHDATMGNGQLTIQTLEGPFTVRPGDQVMRGLQGEFYQHQGGDFFQKVYADQGPAAR